MTSAARDQIRAGRRPTPPGGHRALVRCVAAVAATLLLAGCGLRLETPAPTAPEPDLSETVRQRAAADAALLADLARAVAVTEPDLTGPLEAVATAADTHLAVLGGLYVPFPDAAEDDAAADAGEASPSPAPQPPVVADVVALLEASAGTAAADADTVAQGPLARLLAVVSASRTLHGEALAGAAGSPALSAVPPIVPAAVPAGVTASGVTALVQGHDALGLAWEVVAARSQDTVRTTAAVRAADHRSRGQAWALAGAIAGTGLDPRRAAYDLPAALRDAAGDPATVAAVLAELEGAMATTYATLVDQAEPGARRPLLDGLVDAGRASGSWSAPALPGLDLAGLDLPGLDPAGLDLPADGS